MKRKKRLLFILTLLIISATYLPTGFTQDYTTTDGTVSISEPVPPPAAVRETFNLDPFYEQWIDVEGLPVVASAKVSPYAVKEAVWLIRQMIGHRQDILQALAKNNVRFAVMAYNELTTQIPEHSDLQPDYYWDRRARGLGPTPARPAVSCGEENLLNYQGDPYFNENILVHEFAHAIHQMGLNTVDPSFDDRLEVLYDAAVEKRLWENTYAITNKAEYWAEGTQSWFDTNRANDDEHNHVDTRDKLKAYDPALAALLTEVFGDGDWRYTQAVTRTYLAHLQGFNPEDSPKFEWPAESIALTEPHQQLKNPDSDGGGKWIDLKRHDPSQLSSLTSDNSLTETEIIFVNLTEAGIAYYWVDWAGEERHYGNVAPGDVAYQHTYTGHVWLVKDTDGGDLAVFRAEEKTGRALLIKAELKADVNGDGTVNIQDLVQVAANLGATGENPADVNGDGVVNIQDLVQVAGQLGAGAAAPSTWGPNMETTLTRAEVEQWLTQVQQLNLTDATSQRGIRFLEQLLLALTPKETALLPNYPNPFNPETWIPYQLAEPAEVTLRIHAIDGTLVRTLSLGHKAIGTYQSRSRAAYWDGRNRLGEPVASGVYFYTLIADDFTATRKMLIRK